MHGTLAAFAQYCSTVLSFLIIAGLDDEKSEHRGFGDQKFALAWVQGSAGEFALEGGKVAILGHSMDDWFACC